MSKIHYSQMLLHEFRAALRDTPIAWVPIGLLEWHSDHLPLGTDVIRAEWVCNAAATKFGGVVLPALYCSCPGYSSFEGTLTFSPETAVRVASELAEQLEKVGFRAALFLSAHGGPAQNGFLDRVSAGFAGKMALLTLQIGKASRRGGHAGPFETSDVLAAAPDLVELARFQYPENPIKRYPLPPEQLRPKELVPWVWDKDVRQEASKEIGLDSLARILDYCADWLTEQGISVR